MPGAPFDPTIVDLRCRPTEMIIGKTQNRRRADATERTEALKGAVRTHGGRVARTLAGIAITAALCFGGRAVYRWALASPSFGLAHVEFRGLHRATEAELLKLSGLVTGQNLFGVDVGGAERAMAAGPWIRSVEITRHFPRSLSVEIHEHEPVAMVLLADLYLLDAEATPFKKVAPLDALDLPLITGVDRDAYVAQPRAEALRIQGALAAARAYAQTPSAKVDRLSEIRLEPDGGLTLIVGKSGVELRLGEGELDAKLARLERVRSALSVRGLVAEVIHLDNRARPAWVAVKTVDFGKQAAPKAAPVRTAAR